MLCEEIINDELVRHYSNENKFIRQVETGIIYLEAVDIIPCKYTYEETDIVFEDEDEEEGAEQI